MNLSQIKPPKGQVRKQRRVGQGMGSGRGKYSGRGAKGARSISGYSKMRGFEGGQMPLHRRLPKRGFTNPFKKEYAIVNLGRLEKLEGDRFSPERLVELGVLKKIGDGLKVLAGGELTRKISVKAHLFSADAEKKITALGGSAERIQAQAAPDSTAAGAAPAAAAPPVESKAAAEGKVAKPKTGKKSEKKSEKK
jgi:large subunit ribosomal protein L15